MAILGHPSVVPIIDFSFSRNLNQAGQIKRNCCDQQQRHDEGSETETVGFDRCSVQ